MKTLCVLQHIEAEYLGLIEDHLEARSIRFRYCRPFVAGGRVPEDADGYDGLILLGAGPLGAVSGPLIPSLAAELRLTADFLKRGLPVVGIGLGAVILATAAGGGAVEAPLRFTVGNSATRLPDALAGHLPDHFPVAIYMRDRPVLPETAEVLANDATGEPVVFQIGERRRLPRPSRHQVGDDRGPHHGIRRVPEGTAETLARSGKARRHRRGLDRYHGRAGRARPRDVLAP